MYTFLRSLVVLLVACLACGSYADDKPADLLKKIDGMLDAAMKGYNDNDAAKYYADFLKKLRERDDLKDHFATFNHDENKEKFGKYVSRKYNQKDSVLEDDLMVVHYEAVFEKVKKVKLMAALGKEDGKPRFKLIDWHEDK